MTNECESAKHIKPNEIKQSNPNTLGSNIAKQALATYQNKHGKSTTDDSNSSDGTSRSRSSESSLHLKYETDFIDLPHISTNASCLSPKLTFNSVDLINSSSPDASQTTGDNDESEEDSFSKDKPVVDQGNLKGTYMNDLSVLNLHGSLSDDSHDSSAMVDDSSIDTVTFQAMGNSQDFLVEMFGNVETVKETEIEPNASSILSEVACAPLSVNLVPGYQKDFKMASKKYNILSENFLNSKPEKDLAHPVQTRNILDRFQMSIIRKVESLVVTGTITNFVESPYSQKMLKPFIRRDIEMTPAKLKLLRSIQFKNKEETRLDLLHPIDFCYVQPNHMAAVNTLASLIFWPSVDLTEVLQYPDFSCVVLYRRLCIGFAFLVPDTRWNESYLSFYGVHPDWKNSGIGTYMLYHIIQTNMGKDLTLHVSANNPAVFLYHKFGFKVEEFVRNFYDKYLPPDSNECKHALFLRLSR